MYHGSCVEVRGQLGIAGSFLPPSEFQVRSKYLDPLSNLVGPNSLLTGKTVGAGEPSFRY